MHLKLSFLRQKLGYSQQHMADMLGISRPTYIQIEKGERDLTVPEAKTLAEAFGMTLEEFLKGKTAAKKIPMPKVQIPKDKILKFKTILLYILGKVGALPNIGETAIYKIFYFIDFDYFEEHGKKLIGATYIKNHYGPTPVEFKKIVEDMEKQGLLAVAKSQYFQYEQKKYLPRVAPDLNIISGAELDFIDKELARLSGKNARELSDFSHGDAPWQITQEGKIINYELVLEREPPYTTHNYWEEWAQASMDDIDKALGPISKEEYEYYMNLPDLKPKE